MVRRFFIKWSVGFPPQFLIGLGGFLSTPETGFSSLPKEVFSTACRSSRRFPEELFFHLSSPNFRSVIPTTTHSAKLASWKGGNYNAVILGQVTRIRLAKRAAHIYARLKPPWLSKRAAYIQAKLELFWLSKQTAQLPKLRSNPLKCLSNTARLPRYGATSKVRL